MSMEFLSLMWNSSGVNAGEELQRYLRTKAYLKPKAGPRPGLLRIGSLDNAHTTVSTRTFWLVLIYYYLYMVNTRLINDNARLMITASPAKSFIWRVPSLAKFPRAELSSVRRSSPCWSDQQG